MKNKPKCRNTHIYVLAMNMIGEWMSIISGIYFTGAGFIRHLRHWESRTYRNYTFKLSGAQDDKAVWSPLRPSTIDWTSASIVLAELLSSAPRFIWSLDVPKNDCEHTKNVWRGILPQCRRIQILNCIKINYQQTLKSEARMEKIYVMSPGRQSPKRLKMEA